MAHDNNLKKFDELQKYQVRLKVSADKYNSPNMKSQGRLKHLYSTES